MAADSSTSMPSTAASVAEPWLRTFGGVSYAILATCSICLYALLALVLFHHHRYYKRSAFFIITWQLIVCDVLNQSMQLVLAVPTTASGREVYDANNLSRVFVLVDTATYYGTVAFSLLMTLNRASVFFLPNVNRTLFEAPNIYATILGAWLMALTAPLTVTLAGCRKTFTTNGTYAYTDCNEPQAKAMWTAWYYVKTYCPVLMMSTYVAIFLYLRYLSHRSKSTTTTYRSDKEKQMRRREQRLLLQSFLICGTLEMENLVFNNVKYIPATGQWVFIVCYLQNWLKILNGSMAAIILFAFNAEIRSRLLRMLRIRQEVSSVHRVTTMSVMPSGRSKATITTF